MVIKKYLNFVILSILALCVIMTSGFASDLYVPYKTIFTTPEVSKNVFVSGYACTSSECSSVDYSSPIELYSGNTATTCWIDYNLGTIDVPTFFSCMDGAKLESGYQDIDSDGDFIVVKYDTTKSFGYLSYFSTSDDSYFVKYDRITDLVCEFSTCFDSNYRNLQFVKGVDAIAEIGNLNIINTDDKNKPVQVTVPVEISSAVCSAYQLSNPNWWRAVIPAGYSDYSAATDVKLTIKNDDTNEEYFSKRITTSIFADNCATLNSFEWTPSLSIENERVEFTVESHVVDNQVVSSTKDYSWAYETIYPSVLDSTCYARVQDFMLSNDGSFALSSEVTQITVGEPLFANFKSGAFRDDTVTPMDFTYSIFFDNNEIVNRNGLNAGSDIDTYSEDISSHISSLPSGVHQVKVVVTPVGLGCDINSDVTQIQNLNIVEPLTYDVGFRVLGTGAVELSGALINFDSSELTTSSNGEVTFTDNSAGVYNYVVSYPDYISKFGTISVSSDIDITITLSEENSLPVVDFLDSYTEFYINTISVNAFDYIVDYNEGFSTLDVVFSKVSGDSSYNYNSNSGVLTFTSSGKSETSTFDVVVTDSSGAVGTDSFSVVFTDNEAPTIVDFSADSYDGYKVFTTNFNIDVTDSDGDLLSCSINFGDGSIENGLCSDLDRISHAFTISRDYNVVLTVTDGNGNEVLSDLDIYVYEEVFRPYIDLFTVVSSEELFVPTDLMFTFIGLHENVSEDISCELIVNGALNNVGCDSSLTLNDYNVVGTGTFEFKVTDINGDFASKIITMTFEEAVILEPYVHFFSMTSSEGPFVSTDLMFIFVGLHEDVSENINCELIVNGVSNNVGCDSSLTLNDYNVVGTGTFEFKVTDNNGNFDSTVLEMTFEEAEVFNPFITSFDMTSSNGIYLETNLTFDFVVGHETNDESYVCELFINDVSVGVIDCNSDYTVYDYELSGEGKFELVVTDLDGDFDNSIIVSSFDFFDYKPFITSFDMNSSNGNLINTDLTFDFVVGHEDNEVVICELFINDNTVGVIDCDSNYVYTGFNTLDLSNFKLSVTDLDGDEVTSIINSRFTEPVVELSQLGINLLVNRNLELSKFDFSLEIENESMARRLVGLRPELICDGSRSVITDLVGREMAEGIYSSNDNIFVFDFELDTRDFNLHIREGTCVLKIVLVDDIGAEVYVSRVVDFSLPTEEVKISSIRGNGIDVMNYMTTALLGGVSKGYNDISFNVYNREDFTKKLSVTVISSNLGISYTEQVAVTSGGYETVGAGVYIDDSVAPGMYPVKYSINYGTEKYSRYSYIRVD